MIVRARPSARAVATALATLLLLAACQDPGSFRGIALDPPEPAPAMRLATAQGDTFDLAEQRGKVVLLFFGYTQCPDVCPTTLSDWARIRTELGDDADEVRFVFVSVDPARDTPQASAAYARKFDPSFVGLTADPAMLPTLMKGFKITAFETPAQMAAAAGDSTGAAAPGASADHAGHAPAAGTAADSAQPAPEYYVAHSSQVFLVDPDGKIRALYPSGATTQDLLADVRRVMD
jgi:protein SCO1/2